MSALIRRWWERRRVARRLGRVELFGECSPAELAAVDSLLTELRLAPGRVLMHEGSRGLDFVVVAEGTASVERHGRAIGEVGAGSFLGELALLDEAPRTATVTARTPMRVYALNPFEFHRLLEVAPSVRTRVLDTARRRAAALAHAA